MLLLKPETFMNLSGQSVGEAMRFYKLSPGDVTVFHDELDLAPGKLRAKTGGGHAGHNGLRSMHQHIGEAYHRIPRLGIGHPGHKDRVAGYVLSDFAKADQGWLDDLMRGMSDGAPDLAKGDTARLSERSGAAHGAAAQLCQRGEGGAESRSCEAGHGGRCPQPAAAAHGQVQVNDRLRTAFMRQGEACAMLGSPFMGRLMPLLAERLTPRRRRRASTAGLAGRREFERAFRAPAPCRGAPRSCAGRHRPGTLRRFYPPAETDDDALLVRDRHGPDAPRATADGVAGRGAADQRRCAGPRH